MSGFIGTLTNFFAIRARLMNMRREILYALFVEIYLRPKNILIEKKSLFVKYVKKNIKEKFRQYFVTIIVQAKLVWCLI